MGEFELAKQVLCEFEGMAPTGASKRLIRIPFDKLLRHYEITSNRSKFEEAWLIPDVRRAPSGTWRGLGRVGQEEAICYSDKPSGEFAKEHGVTIRDMPAAGFFFLVFLANDLEVTKWRFDKEAPDKSGFPRGHAERFGKPLWRQD